MPVHVFERQGELCLCVPVSVDEATLTLILQRWEQRQREGEAGSAVHTAPPADGWVSSSVLAQWRHFPLTLGVIALSVLCFVAIVTPLGWWSGDWLLTKLTFQTVVLQEDAVDVVVAWPTWEEAWRYVTPVFLHFSLMHILFNALMMLELGRRLEMAQGQVRWLLVVLVSALASNAAQFLFSPDSLFGGLSGVVYALIGYGWVYQRLRPGPLLVLPGLMIMALVWQCFAFAGLVALAGLGNVANAAHVGGLLAGVLVGVVLARYDGQHASPIGFRA